MRGRPHHLELPVRRFTVAPLPGERADDGFHVGDTGLFGCAPALFTTRENSTKVRVLNPLTGRDLVPPIDLGGANEVSHTAWITGSVATVDGRTFAFVSLRLDDAGHARLWDLTARTPLSEPAEEVYSEAFAVSDGYILTPGTEEQILLWRLSR